MSLLHCSTDKIASVPSRVPLAFLASNLAAGAEKPTSRTWLAHAQLHEVRQHLMWCFYRAAKTAVRKAQRALAKLPEGEKKSRWHSLKTALAQYRGTVDQEITQALTELDGTPTLLMVNNPPGCLQGMCMWIPLDSTHHPAGQTCIEVVAVVLTKAAGPVLRRSSVLVPFELLNRGLINLAAAKLVAEDVLRSQSGSDQRAAADPRRPAYDLFVGPFLGSDPAPPQPSDVPSP